MGTMKDNSGGDSFAIYQSRLPTARSSHSRGSYEVGESSAAASLNEPSTGTTTLSYSSRIDPDESNSSPHAPDQGGKDLNHEVHRRRRSHKPRSSGGFLLANPLINEPPKPRSTSRDDGHRRSRLPVDSRKGKGSLAVPDKLNATGAPRMGLGIDGQEMRRSSDGQTQRTISPIPDEEERRHSHGGRGISRIPTPTPRPSTAPLDVDSTQIVNMALNLSESRRMAERRNMSTPIPPRLAQVPDSLAGGGLKQHLQQQRRTSRNISPRPEKALSPRIMSASTMASPLQSFDPDGSYQYHFSSSTLNRAQKAKEYLELMAQYRRLLQFLPPLLKQDVRSRPSSSNLSTPSASLGSPLNPLTGAPQVSLGRAYNPLQYIRNRKVRARERKAIDGEAQGFSDTSRVTDWIDEAATSAATSALSLGSSSLPHFPGAHERPDQDLPPSNIPRPISTIAKPKRLRIDWTIDPADMLADAYWLEQGDNKYLIEDRHYSKIFSQKPETQVPISYQANEPITSILSIPSIKEGDVGDATAASETDHTSPTKVEFEMPSLSARERARQKLQDLRGMHHKPNNASHSHDFLRFRKGSLSDTSDSESDRKRRNRTGTISANGTDLLEKQMMEMLAKEVDEEQKTSDEPDIGRLKQLPANMVMSEKTSHTPEQMRSSKDSRVEVIDNYDKVGRGRVLQGSPAGSGRASLEVPGQNYRLSVELDSSRPASPETRSRGRNIYMPTIGMDISPPDSRPGSPSRKPFSRVKSIFRDRSKERERGADNLVRDKGDKVDSPTEQPELLSPSTGTTERFGSPDRRRSKSLTRKLNPRNTNESHKSHRSMGSIKIKPDEQVGLRTIFKGGAKLDGMIRGGVSKVTDFLWKKDSDTEDSSSSSSSEDSEDDSKRGRLRNSFALSRSNSRRRDESNRRKNYLDVMPPFKSASVSLDKPISGELEPLALTHTTSPPPRSPRFDRLKPPRIDIRKASPPSELEHTKPHLLRDSDVSDTESRPRDSIDKPRDSLIDLADMPSLPASQNRYRPRLGSRTFSESARHWSISNGSQTPQGTQISRREIARIRALILCSGIKAMEISRRAHEQYMLSTLDDNAAGLPWAGIRQFLPDKSASVVVSEAQLYPATAQILSESIARSIQASETSRARFAGETVPALYRRVDVLHDRVGGDLMEMTRRAADEADEVNRDLVDAQRLKAKRVTDTMDKMLRRRRRRFRWARRAGWLAVEWVLVGFMWYVWFVVMLARIVLGVGKGIVGVVRWLLWL